MRTLSRDQGAVSPVMATLLLTATVVVLSASSVVFWAQFQENVGAPAPAIAITSREGGVRLDSFDMKMLSSSPTQPIENFLMILRTPTNGTLVGTPPSGGLPPTLDLYFQLGPSAGGGVHDDNGTTVGVDGLGGFHFRVADIDGDGRFGGGDAINIWYDGNGDQAHQNGRDDRFPPGEYGFELKHRPSESYVAIETRDF